MASYDSESKKIHTKSVANVSKGEESGFWKLICQGANDLTRWRLAFGGLGVGGNCGLMKSLQVKIGKMGH